MKSKLYRWFLMGGVALMLAGGIAPAQAGVSDAWVSAKVKMLLLDSPQVSGFPIDVDTDEGRVTLHGTVSSASERLESGRIARAGTGVVSVRNLIQVVPASRRRIVAIADDRLEANVNAALHAEPTIAASSIHTKSVHKGVVLLAGDAPTLSDHLLALEVTAAVPGVRQVASEIKSPDEFGDREVWFEDNSAPAEHGNAMTDGWITAQTKMRFMTDAEVPAGDIHVDTHRGIVTLFGTVPTRSASNRAAKLTQEVPGVRSVRSELRVVAASQKRQATSRDDQIETAVRQRIADAHMEGADVRVEVRAATARLSGTVRTASNRYAAVAIAHATAGVERVQNDLHIEVQQTSQR